MTQRRDERIAPIAGRSELQNRESEAGQENRCAQIRQCRDSVKRWLRILSKDFRRRLYRAPFFLELIGVLVVGFYAYEAYKQNVLLGKSVAQQVLVNRPVVFPDGIYRDGTDAYPVQARVVIVNFGKTVALEVAAPGEVASAPSKEPAPYDPRCRGNGPPERRLYDPPRPS